MLFSLSSLQRMVTEEVNTPAGQVFAKPEHLNPRALDSKAAPLLMAPLIFFFLFPHLQSKARVQRNCKGFTTSSALCSPQLRLRPAFSRLFPDQTWTFLSNLGQTETFLFQ